MSSLGLGPGCSTAPPNVGPEALVAEDASERERLAAIEALEAAVAAGEVSPEQARRLFKRSAWQRSLPSAVRIAAIDRLLADETRLDDTRTMLGLMLPTETQWPVIEKIGAVAAARNWRSLAPALVRSWSREVRSPADDERPERAALLALFPDQPVEQTVFGVYTGTMGGVQTPAVDVMAGEGAADPSTAGVGGTGAAAATGGGMTERHRLAAWGLLNRIDPDGTAVTDLVRSAAADLASQAGPTAAIGAAARDLGSVPRTEEQLAWVQRLREPEHRQWWSAAAGVYGALTDEQTQGWQLRHAAPALWASRHRPALLGMTRGELLVQLESRLAGREHMERNRSDDADDGDEMLDDWRAELSWGDALSVLVALDALDEQGLAGVLHEQAIADRADTTTEHGGVLDWRDDAFVALPYQPRAHQRLGDRRFVASNDMLRAGDAALFHYHFHAQRPDNRDYAGPSNGDLVYADRFGRACLVFTTVDEGVLNADYYQPGGARLDLGMLRVGG